MTTALHRFIRPARRRFRCLPLVAVALLFVAFPEVFAQKLPSAEKVVDSYIKTIGGKKRVATIRDANYEWTVQRADGASGVATTQLRGPASVRTEIVFGAENLITTATPRSAWIRASQGELKTLTDAEAATAKLQASLDAMHLLDYKKRNVLARVLSLRNDGGEPAYVVEFSLRNGARLKYWFGVNTKRLLRIEDDARATVTKFEEYRTTGSILEPHLVRVQSATGELRFALQKVNYNQGVADNVFDPPRSEALDVVALLREVSKNQDELEKRFHEYSFQQKETDREINSKGEIKKETIKVYEVFPLPNREAVLKLISENGVPLSGERAAKEQRRVEQELIKAERDKDKDEQRVQKQRAERRRKQAAKGNEEDDDLDVSQFLKIHDFVSPRRERFRDRDAVVFDFRPRPGFKPSNREEDLISKLVGVVWIDPADKQIIRLEARLAEGFKMAGGLLFSLRPGAAFVMEQTRMVEGIWLPRQAQINLTMKFLLFGGGDYNKTIEWSDYKHFSGDVGDYKLETPKSAVEQPTKP